MKKLILLLVVLIPLTIFAIDIRDYSIPDSFYQEAFLRGNFNFKSGNQDQASYDGSFGGNYNINYSSLPLTWRLWADGEFDLYRGQYDGNDSLTGYNFLLNTNVDKYFGDTNFFGYAAFDFGFRKKMAFDDADDPYAKIGIGAGYGRVIDATVLAKSIRTIDELTKYGVVTKGISDAAYLELAQIIDKVQEYRSQYGALEYKKYWYEDMEAVLVKEGALGSGSLQAIGLVRLQEVLDQRYSSRKHGWTVRAGLGYILSNYDGSDSDPSLDVTFEYAHPFSYKLQFIERLDYSTILEDEISHSIANRMSLTYELASQIDWENRLLTTMYVPSDSNLKNIITNTLESSFYYYLTNQVNLNTTLRFYMVSDGIDDNGNDDIETTFLFGVTYRLR